MASSRTNLNPARRALFVAAMKKGKIARKKKKKTTASDDSSEDEAFEHLVGSIVGGDTSPQEEQQQPSSPSEQEEPAETSPINSPPPTPVEAPSSPERGRTETETETAEEIKRLKDHIRKLEHNFETLLQQNESRNIPVDDNGGSPGETQNKRFQEAIKSAIEDCVNKDKRFVRWFPERRGKQLAQVFFPSLMGLPKRPC